MRRALLALSLCPLLGACGNFVLKPIEESRPIYVDDGAGAFPGEGPRLVDFLFVIDNSSSMTREQGVLAASISTLAEVLEDPSVHADYRIAFTSTDNGNPWCPDTTPEGGDFLLESCVDRLGDFVAPATGEDVSASACTDHCGSDTASLGLTGAERPWVEWKDGVSNLAPGVEVADALRCLAPQGVAGCDFASPLESAHKAILRAQTESEAAFGFLRPEAMLVIVVVSDGVDCSYQHEWESIFDSEGERAFWGSEDEMVPTEALCWRAGTHCVEGEGGEFDCESADKDVFGEILGATSDPVQDAVLHPLTRYVDALHDSIWQDYWAYPKDIFVTVIGGVDAGGQPVFTTADPEFMDAYGIGPGCTSLDGDPALPPLRSIELASRFGELRNFSICDESYDEALRELGKLPREQLKPSCYTECVQDQDPETPLVQPECVVTRTVGHEEWEVPECLRGDGEYLTDPETHEPTLPEDSDICFTYRVDAENATPGLLDDLSFECAQEGYNLEFDITRRPETPFPAGEQLSASCILSELPQLDCPEL